MSRAAETTPARFLGIADGTGFLGRRQQSAERAGFEAFFRIRLRDRMGPEWDAGATLAAQVCFAQGALACVERPTGAVCPYPAHAPAHAAWRDGFNAMAHQALEIED